MSAPQRVDRKEYRRVRPTGEAKEKGRGAENEIRVTAQRGQRSYISYAIAQFNGEDGKAKQDTVKISGMGAAIYNAVNIAEIVKRRVKGLHQVTEISSETVKDSYEGVDSKKTLEVERKVATVLITLSTKQLDKKAAGYQAPLPESEVTEEEEPQERKPSERRGSGRGGRDGRRSRRGGRGGADKKDDEKKETKGKEGEEKKDAKPAERRGGRGRGDRGSGSGRGGRGGDAKPAAEKKEAKPATEKKEAKPATEKKEKVAKPDYQALGDEFEDKLDRQKGEGHHKQAPKGQSKPKSVRTS